MSWFHIHCQNINSGEYSLLGNTSVAWICSICNIDNDSLRLFPSACDSPNNSKNSELFNISIDSLEDHSLPKYQSSPIKYVHTRTAMKPLRIINVNCQSLLNKLGEWRNLLDTTEPDIIIATETWLTESVRSTELECDGYTIYRRDRTHGTRGGILIAISNSLNSTEVNKSTGIAEILWVKVMLKGQKHLLIGACYRPNVADKTTIPALEKTLAELLNNRCQNTILAGDFNFPGWDWDHDDRRMKPDSQFLDLHNDFARFIDDYNLKQVVTENTRLGNILDLVLTNIPNRINRCKVIPGISDHDGIPFVEVSLNAHKKKAAPRTVHVYRRADWAGLKSFLTTELENIHQKNTVEEIWNLFREVMNRGMQKFIPKKKFNGKAAQPWISHNLKEKIKLRDRLYKRSKKYGQQQVDDRFKALKSSIQKQIRAEHRDYVSNMITEEPGKCEQTSKKFWSYIKCRRSENIGVGTLRVDNKLITDPRGKAEALNNQFKSAFSEPSTKNKHAKAGRGRMPKITISAEGVKAELLRLDISKACGPDGFGPRVLKETASAITTALTHLFQRSLDTSQIPRDWKTATVSPVFKKGDRYLPSNYRPISLTCVCSKLMEHIITSNLKRYLEGNNILHKNQHGFRSRRSCETQLVELTSEISNLLDQHQEIDACVLDFSKAFDKVNHVKLVEKVSALGVSRQVSNWIREFLTNRTQVVTIDGYHSSSCNVSSGVPQGSVIGPCLFLMYINDLPENLLSGVRLFADDTILYTTADCSDELQKDLKSLEEWEKKWDMHFNPSKCEHITFSRKKSKARHNTYHLHGETIPKVNTVKYLGVKLHSSLKWNENTNYISNKANNTLGFIRRSIPSNLSRLRNKAYKQLLRPILEYACTTWDAGLTKGQTDDLERIQRRAARTVKNIPRTDWITSTSGIIQELKWEPLQERRKRRRLGLFRAIHYGEVAGNVEDHLTYVGSKGKLRRHDQQYLLPHVNTNLHGGSFFVATAKLWNALKVEDNRLCPPDPA